MLTLKGTFHLAKHNEISISPLGFGREGVEKGETFPIKGEGTLKLGMLTT
jgi:hypothetical protein